VNSNCSFPDHPAPAAGAVGRPRIRQAVAVLLSRFPRVTETFILREVIEMERQGQPVVLVPLLRESPDVVHDEARPWIERALYTPFMSASILAANIRMLRQRPLPYLSTVARVTVGALASPHVLVRTLALFPKAVYLAERLERDGIRHVHAHFATHPTTAALIIASLTGMTFSCTAHAHDIFVRRRLLGRKLRQASFVRTISAFNRTFLLERYRQLPPSKVHVIHAGIDPARYAPGPQGSVRVDDGSPPTILCVASLQPYKGIPVLIEACRWLRDRGPAFRCDIAGDGWLRPQLERQIAKAGLATTVRLLGHRRQDEVAELMRRASLFVLPSVVARDGQMEGIPVSLMEAMASELPVVASSLSGIPELVEDGDSGYLVQPGNAVQLAAAIERLLRDPALAQRMGTCGRRTVERQFRLDRCVANLLEHLDRVNQTHGDLVFLRELTDRLGAGGSTIGVRRLHDRRDSRVAEVVLADGHPPRELVFKAQKARPGESRPAPERARHEFNVLSHLAGCGLAVSDGVPRPLLFDAGGACVVLESCPGRSLDEVVRAARAARHSERRQFPRSAVLRTGRWLQAFHDCTERIGNAVPLLDGLADRAARLVEAPSIGLTREAARNVRAQVDALRAKVPPSSLRVVGVHRDFWPGNVFVGERTVHVIDFEGFGDGLPYEDIAYFLVQLELFFPSPFLRRQYLGLASAFLEGYLEGNTSFDWTTYELCRIATALAILDTSNGIGSDGGVRHWWRQRSLRAIVTGSVL